MNRRLIVFLVVFLVVCGGGLAYLYSINPTYIGVATIRVSSGLARDDAKTASFVGDEAQALNSSDMLDAVLSRIQRERPALSRFGSIAALRETLAATPVPGTSVIELTARGSERAALGEVLDLWAAVYLESRRKRGTQDRDVNVEQARKNVESIEMRVARKRHELDEFRRQHGIVSSEREENEVVARMKSLADALRTARSDAVDAESRLTAIKSSLADGTPVYLVEDKALIAQLEQRIRETRQKLKELEVRFTPQYLALEPNVKAMHASIRQLEQQIEDTRRTSQQAALNQATQDLAAAQKNVARLEAQLSERRKEAGRFTSQFSEQKAHVDDLARLEAQLRDARERLTILERNDRAREPTYEILGQATVPQRPAYPDYKRYAGFIAAAAMVAGLLSVMLVEFLIPRRTRETPSHAPPIIQIAYPAWPHHALSPAESKPALPMSPEMGPARQLAAPLRELSVAEVRTLWDAASQEGRLAMAALFTGLSLEELAALEWNDVDIQAGRLHLQQGSRIHRLRPPLLHELDARRNTLNRMPAVASTVAGAALSSSDLAGLIVAAAHDADIDQPETIDAETLRHTYICFLVRQGLRLAELEQLVGPVAPSLFLRYRNYLPRDRRSADDVEAVFPAFAAV